MVCRHVGEGEWVLRLVPAPPSLTQQTAVCGCEPVPDAPKSSFGITVGFILPLVLLLATAFMG